jgi:hypothetical protein
MVKVTVPESEIPLLVPPARVEPEADVVNEREEK